MFDNELQDVRRYKWRVDTPTRAVFTVDDARTFLHEVGFCLEYPLRNAVLAPTFIGAVIGSDQNLPIAKAAFLHPRAKEAVEFKDRLLREKSAFEAGFGEDDNLLIAAAEFPYFFAIIGDRNPKQPPSPGERGERQLLKSAWELIEAHGPILEADLRERLGEFVSDVALSRTLSDLRQKLRIVRIDDSADSGGAMWDLLLRWSPDVVNQGKQISVPEALSALVAKYLETCVAAEQKDVEEFFGHITARSKVTEVIKALLSAREFGFIQVNSKTLLRNTPRITAEEKAAQIAAAAAPKPEGRANRSFRARPEGEASKKNVWEKFGPRKGKFVKPRATESFEKRPAAGKSGFAKPWKKSEGEGTPRREWKPREGAAASGERPRRDFKKPGGLRDFGGAPKRPWQRTEGGSSPPRREFKPRDGSAPPRREWKPREGGSAGGDPRREGKPREGAAVAGDRPRRDFKKPGGPRDFSRGPKRPWQKTEGAGAPRREWKPREGGAAGAERPKREWKPREGGGAAERPRRDFASAKGDWKKGPNRPWQPREGAPAEGQGERPSAASGFKKPSGFKRPGGFNKTGPGGFKKPGGSKKAGLGGFKKPGGFKKAGAGGFKKPFKKSARPGGGSKSGPRRPS